MKAAQASGPVKGFDLLQRAAHDQRFLSVGWVIFDYL
jgi:hypothetical protein